jgi:hypothetical protein
MRRKLCSTSAAVPAASQALCRRSFRVDHAESRNEVAQADARKAGMQIEEAEACGVMRFSAWFYRARFSGRLRESTMLGDAA